MSKPVMDFLRGLDAERVFRRDSDGIRDAAMLGIALQLERIAEAMERRVQQEDEA